MSETDTKIHLKQQTTRNSKDYTLIVPERVMKLLENFVERKCNCDQKKKK